MPSVSGTVEDDPVPSTMNQAVHRFFLGRDRGPIMIVCLLAVVLYNRCVRSKVPLSVIGDGAIVAAAIVFWWFQEYWMHSYLLHSKFHWIGRRIHDEHHAKPYFHVAIDPAPLMVGWFLIVHLALCGVMDPSSTALSAAFGYGLAGCMYEFAHFLAHTRVPPRHPLLRRIRNNHMRHHLIDSNYWFAFGVPYMDDFFGTNPPPHTVSRKKQKKKD